MKKYDFIFGLGRACACSQSLRLAGLQLLSLPWDWIAIERKPNRPDILDRIKIIKSGFRDWFLEEDMQFVSTVAERGKDLYRNARLNILYPHDFPAGCILHEAYPKVKAKYDRRIERFNKLMAESNGSVLVTYMDSPVSPKTDVKMCKDAWHQLQEMYPHVKVDFLMFTLETGRPFEERTVENSGDGFIRVSFDFKDRRPNKQDYSVDMAKCAAVMKSLASVRDYRSTAEKKAMDEQTRRMKMHETGAKNAWEYFLIRRKRELTRLINLIFRRHG